MTLEHPARWSFSLKVRNRFFRKDILRGGLATLSHAPRMCLRCFPPGRGDLKNWWKVKRMARTESTRATVYNKAGARVRKMENSRWLTALFIPIILYAGIYF